MEKLSIKFKGDRSYLHGTDFFQEISKKLASIEGKGAITKLVFKSFATKQCYLAYGARPESTDRIIGNGIWLFGEEGETLKFWIVEGDAPVTERYPFDEHKLVGPLVVENDRIVSCQENQFSVIENVVAMTKKLNYQLTPEINGKWVFGQINLVRPMPDRFNSMEVRRTSERQGKFSCNDLVVDNTYIGEIRFIVGRP